MSQESWGATIALLDGLKDITVSRRSALNCNEATAQDKWCCDCAGHCKVISTSKQDSSLIPFLNLNSEFCLIACNQ